jgi:hypothetical protein
MWSRIMFFALAGLLFVSVFAFRRVGERNALIASTAAIGYLIIAAWLIFPRRTGSNGIAVGDLLFCVGLLGARTT